MGTDTCSGIFDDQATVGQWAISDVGPAPPGHFAALIKNRQWPSLTGAVVQKEIPKLKAFRAGPFPFKNNSFRS